LGFEPVALFEMNLPRRNNLHYASRDFFTQLSQLTLFKYILVQEEITYLYNYIRQTIK